MRIVETFVAGKLPDPAQCEDRLVVTADHAAVIDGATDISGARVDGRTGGRFAADVVAAAVAELPPAVDARAGVDALTAALAAALAGAELTGEGARPPCAAVVVYSAAREEVWRVGDCGFAVDGVAHPGGKLIDEVTTGWRRAWTEALLLRGVSVAELRRDDPGLTAIWPLVELQHTFANTVGSPFSYGVLDGRPVPDEHLQVVDTTGAGQVVLASDGYPTLPATLADAEAELAGALAADPLALGRITANRAHRTGWASFDDRAWIRLQP